MRLGRTVRVEQGGVPFEGAVLGLDESCRLIVDAGPERGRVVVSAGDVFELPEAAG